MPENNRLNDRRPVILAVDDKVENLDILSALLADYEVRDVTDASSALRVLQETSVDLILLDIVMPDIDGFELCTRLQAEERTRSIPIIFISAMSDEEAIQRAFEIGGKDYVTKPFRPLELLARVKTQLQLKFLMERLHFLAFHDPLTGIHNRRRFFELATELFESPGDLMAVMLDIDHFKRINDTHGHGIGDRVLKQVATTIASRLPPEAIFGRLGGEEFAILLPNQRSMDLVPALEAIRQAIADLVIPTALGGIGCTISCGVYQRDYTTHNIDELLYRADQALYEAKGTGRNRVIFRHIQNQSS